MPDNILQDILDQLLDTIVAVVRVERAAGVIFDADEKSARAIAARGMELSELEVFSSWLMQSPEGLAYREQLTVRGGAASPSYLSRHLETLQPPAMLSGHLVLPLSATTGVLRGLVVLMMQAPNQERIEVAAALTRAAAVAVEQAAVGELRAAELAQHRALLEIVREVGQGLDLPNVLAVVCRKTVEAFGCQSATVFFYSGRRGASLPLADYGTPPHVAARFLGSQYGAGNIPHEREVAAGNIIVINRGDHLSPEDIALLDDSEAYGVVMMPLRADDGTIRGVLNIRIVERRKFTAEELRALEAVAHHAATAIMRARFVRATRETAGFRAAVSALAVELNTSLSRTQTLHLLCSRGREIFGVGGAVFLLRIGERLTVAASHGTLTDADQMSIGLHQTSSPAVRAFASGAVVLENERGLPNSEEALGGMGSLLAIPLVGGEGRVGVLILGDVRPRRFRPSVVGEAPVLGALAGAVLRNLDLVGQLHESNQELQRVSMLKDQFLANVSHDLRTPLNVIIGYAQLALEDSFGGLGAELRGVVERILASAHDQLNLVQDLLDLSRLELHTLAVNLQRVPLGPLFEAMEFLATSLVRHKPVRVAVALPAADLCVTADPHRLRQVLGNLLSNAAKFTDEGTIELRAAPAARVVHIDIADTGVGIPAAEREAIFEPFRQVEGERAALGTGLGLAIARRLTELMGGTLTVESLLGHGSTFRLIIATADPETPA